MRTLLPVSAACALCAFAAGCAVNDASRFTAVPAYRVGNAITVGKSTKAEVAAALGKTTQISFDSGFEVWAYQYQDETPGRSEFVVLFAPSGIVAKTRSRHVPYPAGKAP